jgi:iron complex transport system permease protein
VLTAASLAIGARGLPVTTVWQALTQFDPGDGDHAVVHARIPRTVLGLLAGGALGLAGAAMQGVARNPLADPGIMGVNAGAALAVVTGIYVFGISSLTGYIWFAFIGAAAAAVVVYLIASLGRDGATPVKLALAGAALSAGLFSLMNVILVSSQDTLDRFRFWQVGGIAGRDWSVVLPGCRSSRSWPSGSSSPAASSTAWPWVTTSPAALASAWASRGGLPPWGLCCSAVRQRHWPVPSALWA